MIEREMLELAAKAAGIELQWFDGISIPACKGLYGNSPRRWFNPLADDGDALRLAVRLNLAISIEEGQSWAHHEQVIAGSPVQHDGKDPYAATRRAIVRAAAEIGRGVARQEAPPIGLPEDNYYKSQAEAFGYGRKMP